MNKISLKYLALIGATSAPLIAFLFMVPYITLAFGELDPGGLYNPINVQITPSPSVLTQQAHDGLLQAMRNTPQGAVSGCKAQYNAISSYTNSLKTTDTSNPHDARRATSYLNSLYDRYNLCVKYNGIMQACPAGYSKNNGVCVTHDQGCKMTYGQGTSFSSVNGLGEITCDCMAGFRWEGNMCVVVPKTNNQKCSDSYTNSIWSGTFNDKGGLTCDCKTGYRWEGNACIVIPAKTNDQKCSDSYTNSIWTGTLNGEGELTCDCKTGYRWEGNACVVIPAKTNDQICQDRHGLNSFWGGSACSCSAGYDWNDTRTSCVVTPKIEIKIIPPPIVVPKAKKPKIETQKPVVKDPEPISVSELTITASSSTPVASSTSAQEITNTNMTIAPKIQQEQIQVMPVSAKRGFWSRIKNLFGF